MNRILFHPHERDGDGRVTLRDRRARHIRQVLHAQTGDTLKVGEINGRMGSGCVEAIADDEVRLTTVLDAAGPEPWIDLLLAVPRPKVLKRLWAQLAALGVGRIILVNAVRVERCYFDTHGMTPEAFQPLLTEGLEQAGTTRMPDVWIRRGFKPFVEDELQQAYGDDSLKLLAHPGGNTPVRPSAANVRPLLAIGPEGGWVDYELEQLESHGFRRISMGPRILRTDTACIALLGRLMPLE